MKDLDITLTHIEKSLQSLENRVTALEGKRSTFKKPTLEEVSAYCKERNKGVHPEPFIDHYESNGWMVGKVKMKDWRAAVRKWERNNTPKPVPVSDERRESMKAKLKDLYLEKRRRQDKVTYCGETNDPRLQEAEEELSIVQKKIDRLEGLIQ